MSFASGFKMGSDISFKRQEADRQKVLDDRATEQYGQQQTDRTRLLGLQANEDAAAGSLASLSKGVYEGGNWATPAGYGADGPVPQSQQHDPSAGLKPRQATDREYNQAFQNVAIAKRDMAGLSTLRTEGRNLDYGESIQTSNTEWDGKSNDEKAALIKQYSYDQSIRGHGNWVKGTGKTEGYMNFMPDNGDPVRLNNKEVRDFFSLTNAMKIDPVRARKEMDGVSDKVRAMAKEVFDEQTKAAKETNDTRKDIGQLGIMQQTADQQGEYQRGSLGIQSAQLGLARERMNQAGGGGGRSGKLSPVEALTKEAERMVQAGHFKNVPKAIEALKRGAARDHDNDAWLKAETEMIKSNLPDADIAKQRQGFFVRRGHAPPEASQIIQSGVNPKTKAALSPAEVADFNKRYPMSAIEIEDLPWAKAETRRMGLVNQIPR